MISQVGAAGVVIIAAEVLLFLAAVFYGWRVSKSLRPHFRRLSISLREFNDEFGDEDCLVARARTRYRRALEQIENVNPHIVVDSILADFEAVRILGKRLSYSQFEQLYKSIPGMLVTLGLLGTFIGLTANLGELASILDSSRSSPTDSLLKASRILEPMATAFITSLVGVALSMVLWLIGTIQGTHTLVEDIRELTSAYLDQVVQANSKKFSLLKESVDRMEGYLSDFLANFSQRVGIAIDKAMTTKIGQVFDSIKQSAEAYSYYVKLLDEGSTQLNQSALRFYQASNVFGASDFAERFGTSTSLFLEATSTAAESIRSLIKSSQQLDEQLNQIRLTIEKGSDLCSDSLELSSRSSDALTNATSAMQLNSTATSEAAKQLREARLAVGRDARANETMLAQLNQALLSFGDISEQIVKMAAQVNELMPNQFKMLTENMLLIRQNIDSSLEVFTDINQKVLENIKVNSREEG